MFKMASGRNLRVFGSQKIHANRPMSLPGDKCVSCSNLREEVKSIAMELKSAWKIIKILEEEVKCDNRVTTPRPNLDTAWTKVTEARREKKINHNNLISVPITSNNRFHH